MLFNGCSDAPQLYTSLMKPPGLLDHGDEYAVTKLQPKTSYKSYSTNNGLNMKYRSQNIILIT